MKFNLREYTRGRGPDTRADEDLHIDPGFDGDWRLDPKRERPLGYSWRLPTLGNVPAIPKMKSKSAQKIIDAIVADAILSAHCYPGRRVSYSRRQQWWQRRSRYSGAHWTAANVTAAVDALVAAGLLAEHDKKEFGKRGRQSSYLPSLALLAFDMPVLAENTNRETMILKDKGGVVVPYQNSQRIDASRKLIERVNKRLAAANIELRHASYELVGNFYRKAGSHTFPSAQTLYRIFNGGWALGGRFYGAFWQQVSASDRGHIFIDSVRTEEADFAQIHPRILYSWVGKRLVGDAYTIPGWEAHRDTLIKAAFNAILNAPTYLSAKGAVAKKLEAVGLKRRDAGKLLRAICDRHPDIAKHFHSGVGTRLQNLDARMCEHVLTQLTVQSGIVVLPIHDSFIVPAEHLELLVRTMKDAYEAVMGKIENRDEIVKVKIVDTATRKHTKAMSCAIRDHTDPPKTLSYLPLRPILLPEALGIQESKTPEFNISESRNEDSAAAIVTASPAPEQTTPLRIISKRPSFLDPKAKTVADAIAAEVHRRTMLRSENALNPTSASRTARFW